MKNLQLSTFDISIEKKCLFTLDMPSVLKDGFLFWCLHPTWWWVDGPPRPPKLLPFSRNAAPFKRLPNRNLVAYLLARTQINIKFLNIWFAWKDSRKNIKSSIYCKVFHWKYVLVSFMSRSTSSFRAVKW